jgi:hypothetical protein
MKQRAKQSTENLPVLQTYCLYSTEGHRWMQGWFDTLPAAVRQRLRS